MKRLWTKALVLALCAGINNAQEDYTRHPGYIDLSGIEIPGNAGEVTEVTIGPELFRMFSEFSGDESKAAGIASPGDGMFSINIKSFDIDSAYSEKVRIEMQKIEKKLQKEAWTPIVRVKSGDENTNISVKFEKGTKKSLGMLIMTLEPGNEATFINIVGSVPLEALGNMGVDMDISALDSLKDVLGEDGAKDKMKDDKSK